MIRDTGETYHSREEMKTRLGEEGYVYEEDYTVIDVPNIVDITYGRDVGYTISEERLDKEIEEISATEIRARHDGS